jgi:hypothetical protein
VSAASRRRVPPGPPARTCPLWADPARAAWRADYSSRERAAHTNGRPSAVVGHVAVPPQVAHGRRQGEADGAFEQCAAELSLKGTAYRARPPGREPRDGTAKEAQRGAGRQCVRMRMLCLVRGSGRAHSHTRTQLHVMQEELVPFNSAK